MSWPIPTWCVPLVSLHRLVMFHASIQTWRDFSANPSKWGEKMSDYSPVSTKFVALIWVWINSIPINTIFNGMNIHKSQLFWCELQGYKVLTHCHMATPKFWVTSQNPQPSAGLLLFSRDGVLTSKLLAPTSEVQGRPVSAEVGDGYHSNLMSQKQVKKNKGYIPLLN